MIPTRKHFGALLLGLTMTLGLTTSILTPHPAVAQAGLGSLAGTITDSSHAVVNGATVYPDQPGDESRADRCYEQ